MPHQIWVSGPIIELELLGTGVPTTSVTLDGIIDTGASGICIDRRIALQLGLKPHNAKQMQVADGSYRDAIAYTANLRINGLNFNDLVEVWGLKMNNPSSRVLLARSFLKRYIINYDGPRELFHYFEPLSMTEYIADD